MGVRRKNHISPFNDHFLIFYVSKIEFKKSRLKEKCAKKLKRLFNNLIFRNKIECKKLSEN